MSERYKKEVLGSTSFLCCIFLFCQLNISCDFLNFYFSSKIMKNNYENSLCEYGDCKVVFIDPAKKTCYN